MGLTMNSATYSYNSNKRTFEITIVHNKKDIWSASIITEGHSHDIQRVANTILPDAFKYFPQIGAWEIKNVKEGNYLLEPIYP